VRPLKIALIVIVIYVGSVAAFESMIGYMQPEGDGTLVITTFDPDGTAHDRVVSKLDVDGKLYVAANHWPRAWFERALANPEVQATIDGTKNAYTAVRVEGAEHERVNTQKKLGPLFRVLTGFPPRYFLRLDPR
jgi:hypothetical protein